ncbi:MAG: proton-coupled thiamine transporter YuaJ, partial [Thermoleophilia bacterium]|nr:proton-coupled thiamine transporter YuaJ [Thermoleophilia bacterium]
LLGNMRLIELPNGGSVSLAAVPLLAYAAVRGGRGALLACWCAGIAHALSGGTIIHPVQLALDYVLAYGVLAVPALTGAATATRRTIGIVVAFALQLAATTASGVIYFATMAGCAAWKYSLLYNATTTVPELALALVTVPVAIRALRRVDPAATPPERLQNAPRRRPRVAVVRAPRSPAPKAHSMLSPRKLTRPAPFAPLALRAGQPSGVRVSFRAAPQNPALSACTSPSQRVGASIDRALPRSQRGASRLRSQPSP